MSVISTSIGTVFEQTCSRTFPTLKENDKSNVHLPDFSANTTQNLGLETKVSYFTYGAQIKQYQTESFEQHSSPIVYIVGYHTYADSYKKYAEMKNFPRDVRRNFDLDSVYIVSDIAMKLLFEKEKRLSKTAQAYVMKGEQIPPTVPQWYFGLKKRYIDQLMDNDDAKRDGKRVNVREHYGITPNLFSFLKIDSIQFTVSQSRSTDLPIRCIISHSEMSDFTEYFSRFTQVGTYIKQ